MFRYVRVSGRMEVSVPHRLDASAAKVPLNTGDLAWGDDDCTPAAVRGKFAALQTGVASAWDRQKYEDFRTQQGLVSVCNTPPSCLPPCCLKAVLPFCLLYFTILIQWQWRWSRRLSEVCTTRYLDNIRHGSVDQIVCRS